MGLITVASLSNGCSPNVPAKKPHRPSDHHESPHSPFTGYHRDTAGTFAWLLIQLLAKLPLADLTHSDSSHSKIWTESPESPHRPLTGCYIVKTEFQPLHNHHFQFPTVSQDWRETVETQQLPFPLWEIYVTSTQTCLFKPAWKISVYSTGSSFIGKTYFDITLLIYSGLMSG